MPKQVIEKLLAAILDDISGNYRAGDRYRTVREIAERFGVSPQTAQRAVQELGARKVVTVRDRSGVFVTEAGSVASLAGRSIMVVSSNPDPRFNDGFLHGIRQVTEPLAMGTTLFAVRGQNVESLEFADTIGRKLDSSRAVGLITLAFRSADLPFYHLMTTGHLVISDVTSHRLPGLPSVQTDNRRHAAEAARAFAARGKRNILIAGYWPEGNTRHTAFTEAFLSAVPGGRCKYVHLADDLSTAELYLFFGNFAPTDAVYAIDYAANHTVAPYFVSHGVSPVNNLIVYDSEMETFTYRGLPPIQAAAPSLSILGRRLAEKLIARIRIGAWDEPIHELL